MPKETISSDGPYQVKVGYPKGGMVQDQTPGVQVGVEGMEQVDHSTNIEARFISAWAHLDRHGVNQLIRLLRKARDSAFGADQ